ncbi:MAG: YggS family pyridoxal phosphate-dependent enzyme [Verrucomicrobia bacterium]|nr:YggS family pyridoxal phosphate-dependent enzyme [Verrucomicrobiota bacterium]MDA1067409.1 YggS family pyridoxal phosphate-dependent enzyme [Verrucomicrobiota bacterium]
MLFSPEIFEQNLEVLNERISLACDAASRNLSEVKLMAVTKFFPLSVAKTAVSHGLNLLGENRVQEGVEKIQRADFTARWELIGHLQSNKAQLAAKYFDGIQSVDSTKLARRLNQYAAETGKMLQILLQVNTGEDPGKFGFTIKQAEEELETILNLSSLKVEGFMTIAPLPETTESAKTAFNELRNLRDRMTEKTGQILPELSMGMSNDLEAAIDAGSTCIRVGSALFGQRSV